MIEQLEQVLVMGTIVYLCLFLLSCMIISAASILPVPVERHNDDWTYKDRYMWGDAHLIVFLGAIGWTFGLILLFGFIGVSLL